MDVVVETVKASHLVPGISSVRRVDEHGQDLGSGEQSGGSLRSHLGVEVVCALLKHEVCADVGREWEEVHIPEEKENRSPDCEK